MEYYASIGGKVNKKIYVQYIKLAQKLAPGVWFHWMRKGPDYFFDRIVHRLKSNKRLRRKYGRLLKENIRDVKSGWKDYTKAEFAKREAKRREEEAKKAEEEKLKKESEDNKEIRGNEAESV